MARKNLFQSGNYTELLAYYDKAIQKSFPDNTKRLEIANTLLGMLNGGENLELSKLVSLYKLFQKSENPTQFVQDLIAIYNKELPSIAPEPSLANPLEGYE